MERQRERDRWRRVPSHTGCRSEGVYDATQIDAIRRVTYLLSSFIHIHSPHSPPRQLHVYAPYPLVAYTPLIHVHPLALLYSRNRRARIHARPLSGHPSSPTPPPPPSAHAPVLLPALLTILLPLPFPRSLHSVIELCPPHSRLAPTPSSPFTLTIPASTCKIR